MYYKILYSVHVLVTRESTHKEKEIKNAPRQENDVENDNDFLDFP